MRGYTIVWCFFSSVIFLSFYFNISYYIPSYIRKEEPEDSSLPPCHNCCPFTNVNKSKSEAEKKGHDSRGGWFYTEELIKKSHVGFDNGFARDIVKYVTNHTEGRGNL